MKKTLIGDIGNYYGGLSVKEVDGEYFWSIADWNGHDWEKIPESLYKELLKFQEEKDLLNSQNIPV